MFNALARLAGGRPRRVVGLAVLAVVAAGIFGAGVADRLDPYGADDPATESIKAVDRIQDATGLDPAIGIVALVKTEAGPRARRSRARIKRVARRIGRDRAVGRVTTYYESRDRSMVARDGRSQFIAVNLRAIPDGEQQDAAERLGKELNGSRVKLGGFAAASADVNEQVEKDLRRAEMLAFPILFVLSLVFFRSMVGAALPVLVGGFAVVGTFAALKLADGLTDVSVYALNLTTGLGLGLAIDYSLFMVARYREEIAEVGPGSEAMQRTMATAGRTVLFSSLTVAAALASLLVFPQNFLYSMGLGGVLVTIIAAGVALLVLPAVLMLLGERVNALAPRWLRRRAEAEARPTSAGAWYRLSRFVMARPGRVAVVSAAILIAAGTPSLGMNFTWVDATVLPEAAASRQVHAALERDFPPGRTGRISVVVEARPSAAVRRYARRLGALPDAAGATRPLAIDRTTSLVEVFPRRKELSDQSQDLVRAVRAEPAPAETLATGQAAEFVDLKGSLVDHLPIAVLIVVVATILVLFLMTGSLVLPLKALVMNVLTLSATFGLLVLVFQDGRLEGLLDFKSQGALETTQPVLLFALAFGLSTDYGVFLLSRIKEARDRGASDSEAVAIGLERTGRIVTAAAILFSIAIGAFATSEIVFVKESGLGTALAVLIDATLVRALLVPSLMELLGRSNWWAPSPLRRLHDRVGIAEGAPAAARASKLRSMAGR